MFIQGIQRVLDSNLSGYHKPEVYEISGVTIKYKPNPKSQVGRRWKDVLEEWLPVLDERGLLDNINAIRIGTDITKNKQSSAEYLDSRIINLEIDHRLGEGKDFVVKESKPATLVHEVTHHAHIHLNNRSNGKRPPEMGYSIRAEVSAYAGYTVDESIAEIAVGIVSGEQYPQKIHDFYDKNDGPQAIYEIQKTC